MKWFARINLVLVTVAFFATSANAEIMYMNRRAYSSPYHSVIESRDLANSGSVQNTYIDDSALSPGGMALSADGSTLYAAMTASNSTSADIQVYNAATGALQKTISVSTSSSYGSIRGIDVDPATGYIYAAMNNGNIAQINPTTDAVNLTWGTAVSASYAMGDLQIFNGKVYAGGIKSQNYGVYTWDLTTGGVAAHLGSTNTKTDSMTIAPDGTLFTAEWGGSLKVWSSDYSTSTELVNFGASLGLADIDYYDGFIYAARRTDNVLPYAGEISKLDPGTGTYTTWVAFPEATTNNAVYPQYMVIGQTVPEPSTLVLLTCGLLGMLVYAWKKRK